MRASLVASCISALLLCHAPLASASNPEQQARKAAVKALKKNLPPAAAEFALAVNGARDELLAALDDWDAGVKEHGLTTIQQGFLWVLLRNFQSALNVKMKLLTNKFAGAQSESFDIAHDAGIPLTDMPDDFSVGTGGKVDQFLAKQQQLVSRAYDKVRKRLARIAKHLRQHEHAELRFRLAPPRPLVAPVVFDNGFLVTSDEFDLHRIDVLLAFSDVTVDGDVRFYLAGSAAEAEATIYVSARDSLHHDDVSVDDADADGRWAISIGTFAEGNTVLQAGQGGNPRGFDIVVLGMR